MKVGDTRQMEPNIQAGVKYIRFMVDQYYKNEPMDELNKGLFAFASYNAGPARISQFRKLAPQRKLDPNVWFNNVELIAAEKIGRETVTYVSSKIREFTHPPTPSRQGRGSLSAIGLWLLWTRIFFYYHNETPLSYTKS